MRRLWAWATGRYLRWSWVRVYGFGGDSTRPRTMWLCRVKAGRFCGVDFSAIVFPARMKLALALCGCGALRIDYETHADRVALSGWWWMHAYGPRVFPHPQRTYQAIDRLQEALGTETCRRWHNWEKTSNRGRIRPADSYTEGEDA